MIDAESELKRAIRSFWDTRGKQQGSKDARQPFAGSRASVVAGKHADGFIRMIAAIVKDAGLPDAHVRYRVRPTSDEQVSDPRRSDAPCVPGYFRPCKVWDLVVICESDLVAAVEVKSQVGSFGNNFNNRVEEAIGNANDFWVAYREGLFKPSQRPWLGYLFMLQEHPKSVGKTREIKLQPFPIDAAFQRRSYAERYELVCKRLLRERLYDAACFVMSAADSGKRGQYREPDPELGIARFARSLHAHAAAYARVK